MKHSESVYRFNVGDRVRVISDTNHPQHYFKKGIIVTIVAIDNGQNPYVAQASRDSDFSANYNSSTGFYGWERTGLGTRLQYLQEADIERVNDFPSISKISSASTLPLL